MEKYYAIVRRTDSNSELKHWKYIKKLKKNGKWRYYYPGDLLNDIDWEISDKVFDAEIAVEDFLDNKLGLYKRKQMLDAKVKVNRNASERKRLKNQKKDYPELFTALSYNKTELDRYNNDAKDYLKKKGAYQKTILGFPSRVIDSGKAFVDYFKNPKPKK